MVRAAADREFGVSDRLLPGDAREQVDAEVLVQADRRIEGRLPVGCGACVNHFSVGISGVR